MAQLRDTLIQGSARVTDTLYANEVDTNVLSADNLETNLLKINTSGASAPSTSVGINLTNGDTINAHIGTSDKLGLYATDDIIMRPGGVKSNSTEGMVLSTGALNPKDNALTLGSASNRWKSLYTAGYTYVYGNNQWCLDVYIYNKSKTQVGEIYYNSGNADNVTTGQYNFRQWSPNSTADTGTSGFHETFSLPAVTVGRTANAGYAIITTKNLSNITSVGTLTNTLSLKPASGEGGQLQLCASTANTTEAGIVLDQHDSTLRIFGIQSADGTKQGAGTALVIDPYAKTITGGYTFSGSVNGNATNVTGTVAVANGGTGVATTTKNYVFAGPTSANGAPAFRALVAADLPAATTSAKGAIIVGSGLAVSSGTVSISGINTSSGSTTKCLTEKGTWVSFGTSNLALGSTAGAALAASGSAGSATTAAKSDHVHPFPTAANVGAATDDHTHGNITNGGCITTAITAANGDYLIIGDSSASGKLGKGPTFVSTTANKFLKDTGAFTAIAAADLPAATTSAKGAVIVGSGLAVSSGTISINGINTSSGSTTKCLTEKGTWASFTNNAGTVTSVTIKGGTNIDVDSESAITGSGTRTISLSSVQNPLIAASSTAAVTSSPYKSSRWAFNLGVAAADLTTGMMITVKIPQPTNTYGSYVSIDNGTTYKPIAVGTGKGRMTTHYAQNNIITLFYDSAGTVTTYAFNGAASTSDVTGGCWRVLNYYDSGNTTTTVRQSLDTTNKNRPLILAYDDNTVTTVNRDYQTYRCNAIYANPSTGHLYATAVHNAVWNDYAEYRKAANNPEPGRVVIDNDNGTMTLATQRLMPGAQVVSDTWGHIMGETEDAKTPIAVAGRVLVYPFQSRENYHAGMAVCSAPNGTVDIMTREEIRDYPDCIVGIVSEIPDYEEWGSGNVKVNGRIWIRVK